MNILIPMAGKGSRFTQYGYKIPKPLIPVEGKPMIHRVIDNIGIDGNYIFIVQQEHCEQYGLDEVLRKKKPNCKIIPLNSMTEGAACTCLLAKEYINNNEQLLIANCDQLMDWNVKDFLNQLRTNIDGVILTFESASDKNSYVLTDFGNRITETAEKQVISNQATCGLYYWKCGLDFVNSAQRMIDVNCRVNNEFYVCPTYNELIKVGHHIVSYKVNKHYPIGTPEDLQQYLCRNFIHIEAHKDTQQLPTDIWGLKYEPKFVDNGNNYRDLPCQTHSVGLRRSFSDKDGDVLVAEMLRLKRNNQLNFILEIGVSDKLGSTKYIQQNKGPEAIYLGVDNDKSLDLSAQQDNMYYICADSKEYETVCNKIWRLGVSQIDLLHIDGNHSVNQVIRDWEYTKLLSNHGVVILHDISHHPGPRLLFEAVDSTLFDKHAYYVTAEDRDFGIGVLRRYG